MNQTNGQTAYRQQNAPQVLDQVSVPSTTIEQIIAATEARRVDSVMEQARIGFKSKYLPKHITCEEQAIAIALAGQELGIQPMTAFREIYFFDSRVVLSSQLLRALAHRKVEGFRLDIVKTTEAGCWVAAWRPGMTEAAKIAFTIEDAQRAGLTGKDNWKKYPAAMCIARATAMAIRAVAPEAALGVITKEEAEDGVRFELDVTPEGLQVTPQASPVDVLKNQLRTQQANGAPAPAPAPVTPIDKKAARAAPPPGFAADDPSAPPPGFPAPKKKGNGKPETAAAQPQKEEKPADPLDCSKRKEGETFEFKGDRYIVRRTGVGLVPELLNDAVLVRFRMGSDEGTGGEPTHDAPPEYEPGSEG